MGRRQISCSLLPKVKVPAPTTHRMAFPSTGHPQVFRSLLPKSKLQFQRLFHLRATPRSLAACSPKSKSQFQPNSTWLFHLRATPGLSHPAAQNQNPSSNQAAPAQHIDFLQLVQELRDELRDALQQLHVMHQHEMQQLTEHHNQQLHALQAHHEHHLQAIQGQHQQEIQNLIGSLHALGGSVLAGVGVSCLCQC